MILYGHRGARGEAPENTLAGFAHAIAVGVPRVELDVRLSADGELVVIHDASVMRTTGQPGNVCELTAAELASLDARLDTPGWATRQGILRLEEVLTALPTMRHYQIEVKSLEASRHLQMVEQLARLFSAPPLDQRAVITSFDQAFLATQRDTHADLPRGLVSDQPGPEPVHQAKKLGACMLVLHHPLWNEAMVAAARTAGLHCSAWTVNSQDELSRLYQLGIDSVVSDVPSAMTGWLSLLQDPGTAK